MEHGSFRIGQSDGNTLDFVWGKRGFETKATQTEEGGLESKLTLFAKLFDVSCRNRRVVS